MQTSKIDTTRDTALISMLLYPDGALALRDVHQVVPLCQEWQIVSVGRYYDTLVRSGERWLFSSRQVDVERPHCIAGLIPPPAR